MHDSKDSLKDELTFKRPAFIILDREEENQEQMPQSEFYREEEKQPSNSNSFSVRFLSLLGLIFCLIFGVGITALSLISTFTSTFYLFRNKDLNREVLHLWKLTSYTLIAGLGCILGLISPSIGLSLMAIYFSFSNKTGSDSFLHKILRQTFKS